MENLNFKAEMDELNDDYIEPTQKQKEAFGRFKHFGIKDELKKKIITHGTLYYTNPFNKKKEPVYGCVKLPFALINFKKKELIRSGQGYNEKNLTIKYE